MRRLGWILSLYSAGLAPALAHHTREHLMLMQGSEEVIAATRQGGEGGLMWVLWLLVAMALVLGLVRWWRGRHRA